MNKIYKFISVPLLLSVIVAFSSCERDVIEVDNSPKVVFNSNRVNSKFIFQEITALKDTVFSIIDASQGVVSRTWRFDADPNFNNVRVVNDVNVVGLGGDELNPFFLSGTTSSDERLHLAYRTAGTYNLEYKAVFNDSVSAFTTDDPLSLVPTGSIPAVNNDGQWEVTIPFTIIVPEP